MLLPLFVALTQVLAADTILVPGMFLLGEPLENSTFDRAPAANRTPFSIYASSPVVSSGIPGLPVHRVNNATDAGFESWALDLAVQSVADEVYRGGFPGAALAVGRWTKTVLEQGVGTVDRGLGAMSVDPDNTIYDLASLTKVVATTAAVMLLVEDGRLDLDYPVSWYLPDFVGESKDRVTLRHLLSHTSGLPAGTSIYAETPEQSRRRAAATPLRYLPGAMMDYSDIGFIVLWAAADAATAEPLENLLQDRIYTPLGMRSTGFLPGERCLRCAPTADRDGFRGVVHDPLARQLNGIAGNAGLFSTVHDVARFAAMLANHGELDGVRVFAPETIDMFTRRQAFAGTRALGWDTPDENGRGAAGLRISSRAFGHTGFTGTSLWVDPERGTWTVLLTNRTFKPDGPNRMQALRRELNDRVATAVR